MFSVVTQSLSGNELTERVFDGELLLFCGFDAVANLVARTRRFADEHLAPVKPTNVHAQLPAAEVASRVGAVHRAYSRDSDIRRCWLDMFGALGLEVSELFRDRLYLRFQTHRETQDAGQEDLGTAPLPLHRDTWASNIYAQVNWWAPIFPITAERTMALCPALFDVPLANSSDRYDLPAVIEANRKKRGKGRRADDIVPVLLEQVDARHIELVVIQPGEVLAFSGAHLHGSIPNHSGVTRVSIESRTVLLQDILDQRGAPNADGRARWMSPGWFRRCTDDERLSDVLGVDPQCPIERTFG